MQQLAVLNPTGQIRSARIVHSGEDVGTGIDNITFNTVPEPATLTLAALSFAGLAGYGWRRRRLA